MRCAESLRVQAYFDAEFDAVSASVLERHIEHCAECRALLQDLEQVRSVMRRDSSYVHAPPALRTRLLRALDEESTGSPAIPQRRPAADIGRRSATMPRRPAFWMGVLGGVGGTAIAAALALFVVVPRPGNPLLDELVNAHVRSLMPAHLIDVVSSDKHTVKPWFAGHTDVSPVVGDFEAQGYRLIGGRADYLDHQRSAVVVYQHGAHIINVFSWAAHGPDLPDSVTRSGYHIACWRTGDLEYCGVSDTAREELSGLVRLLQELAAPDSRG